jgi:hypothetical protein
MIGLEDWLLLSALVAAAIAWPFPVGVIFCVLVVACVTVPWIDNRRLRRLAAERTREDIGTFAVAFDPCTEPFDPEVVRAVWDALDPYTKFRGGKLPLRPADDLSHTFGFEGDDLGDLIDEVAERSGHTLERKESNPLFGRVKTVGDVVRFVTFQPKETATVDGR